MKNFIEEIKSSIYNPDFYKNLRDRDSSFTVVYMMKLLGTISIITALVLSVLLHSFVQDFFDRTETKSVGEFAAKYIDTNFADDLVITFKDNKLSTNKNEPVIFPLPTDMLNLDLGEDTPTNFLAISPNEYWSSNTLKKYSSVGFMSSTSAYFYDDSNGKMQVVEYSEVSDEMDTKEFVVDKQTALKYSQEFSEYVDGFIPYLYVFIFLFFSIFLFIFMLVAEFLFALITGLIAFLLSKITKSGGSYGLWYIRAVHADTFYILMASTVGWIIPFTAIPILAAVMVIIILYSNKNFA